MKRLHLLSVFAGVLLGVCLSVATIAWAQRPASVTVTSQQNPAGLQGLSEDTFVSIKDHGESQTVIVYKVDEKGTARLTHKAKFFY